MSMYSHDLYKFNTITEEEDIPEIDLESLIKLQEFVDETGISLDNIDEAFIDPPKKVMEFGEKMASIKDLKNQWKKVADSFAKHVWIYRYIKDDKQEAMLHKYHDILCDDNCTYTQYKKAFRFICQFMGLPSDKTIIENIVFANDKKDKEMKKISVKYSKGLARVNIPDNIELVHISPVKGIKELVPSFRSKVKGKYMYPDKRCFFTVAYKTIKKSQAGLEHQKTYKYKAVGNHNVVYIDPTYADFGAGSIFIPTESPIKVQSV